jgi:hypothetical protein
MLVHEVDTGQDNLQIITALMAMEAKGMPDPDGAARLRSTLWRVEASRSCASPLTSPTILPGSTWPSFVATCDQPRGPRQAGATSYVVLALETAFCQRTSPGRSR